jgi:hypothetical protein
MDASTKLAWLLLPVVLALPCPARAQQGSAGGHAPAPAVEAPSVLPQAVPEPPQRKAIPLGMTPEGLAAKERARQGGAVGTDKATVTPDPTPSNPSLPAKGGR